MDQYLSIREAKDLDAAQISKLVRDTIRVSNVQDYPASVIQRVAEGFSAGTIQGFLKRRVVPVACRDDTIVGTASLDGEVVRTVFVSPEVQGEGVGRRLMDAVEAIAGQTGIVTLHVPASLTATLFYARLGYREVREVFHGEERTVVMEKTLT